MRLFTGFLILVIGVSAHAGDLETQTLRRAFLLDLSTRVQAAFDINKSHLRFLDRCLKTMTPEEFADAKIIKGVTREPLKNCKDAVAEVRENTRLTYPGMRKYLLLSNLLKGLNISRLAADLWHNVGESQPVRTRPVTNNPTLFDSGLQVTNPLDTVLSKEELAYADWTEAEIQDAIGDENQDDSTDSSFNTLFKNACENVRDRNLKSWGVDNPTDLCEHTKLRISSIHKNEIYLNYEGTEADKNKLRRVINVGRTFYGDLLHEAQTRIEKTYDAAVQSRPYVALVTSADPTQQEFLHAIDIMKARAAAAIAEHTKWRRENHLDDPNVKINETKLKEMMKYTPIATGLLTRPGPELARVQRLMPLAASLPHLQNTFKTLSSEAESHDMWVNLTWTGVAIAGNIIVCWLPVAKGPKMLAKFIPEVIRAEHLAEFFTSKAAASKFAEDLFSPWCLGLGAAGMDVWMYWDSLAGYNEAYREVFGSFDDENIMMDVSKLSDKERELFWTLATIPIGSGVFDYSRKVIVKQGGRLADAVTERTRGFSERLQKKLLAVQEQMAH